MSPGADSASISCDGGIVAFVSSSSAYSSNGKSNLIVNTRAGGDYITVANPTNSNWGIGGKVQVSCDGNHVAFESSATNLVDPNSTVQPSGQRIYSYSHVDKKIRYVSVTPSGQPMISGDDGQGRRPISISENGRYVVYISNSHLGNTKPQVYITDMVAGTSQILSINSSGDPGDWNSYNPVVSGDGKFVAFDTSANNLITGGSAGSAILSETGY